MNDKNEITNKKFNKKMTQFAVIGLGRFGMSVALSLAEQGKDVLAIDIDPETVKQVEQYVSSAVVADSTGTDILFSLGVQNFDCVINCIGENLQASILTTLICKDLGVNFVITKVKDLQSKKIQEKIGADLVIFPETYMGKKIASLLANPSINEIMKLTNDFKIVEIPLPDMWQNKTIIELDIRKKHEISIIFIKRNDLIVSPEPNTILYKGDILIIAGNNNNLKSLSNKTSEVIDAKQMLNSMLSTN